MELQIEEIQRIIGAKELQIYFLTVELEKLKREMRNGNHSAELGSDTDSNTLD